MLRYMVILLVLMQLHISICTSLYNTSVIYDIVLKAIKSKSGKESAKVLNRHFFTVNKDESIWPLAIREGYEQHRKILDKSEYELMDRDVKRLAQVWRVCIAEEVERTDCLSTLTSQLHSYMKDFQWHYSSPKFWRKDYLQVRVAFQAMELLILKTLSSDPQVEGISEIRIWYAKIKNELLESFKFLDNFQFKIIVDRVDEVSPVTLCEVRQVLWKEFTQGCETRWKRSTIGKIKMKKDEHEASTEGEEEDEEELDESGEEEEQDDNNVDEIIRKDDEFYQTFAHPDLNAVEKLGGITTDFVSIFQAKFIDAAQKKTINVKRDTANVYSKPKGEVLQQLYLQSIAQRTRYVNKVEKEFTLYIKETFGKVKKATDVLGEQLNSHLEGLLM